MTADASRRLTRATVVRFVLGFVAILLIAETGVRAIEPGLPAVAKWREPLVEVKARQMSALGAADIVLAGSSQMLFGADAAALERTLGSSTYNAGIWGAPPVVNEHWLLNVVAPRLHPKTVIFGVSPVDFVTPTNSLDVRDYFAAPAVRRDALGSLDNWASRHFALVRERHNLRNPKVVIDSALRRARGQARPGTGTAAIDGFGHMDHAGNVFVGDRVARPLVADLVDRGWHPRATETGAFERTVRGLKARGIQVVVVNMAVSSGLIGLLPHGTADYSAYLRFVQRATAASGGAFIDAGTGSADQRLFFDYDHVNAIGTTVLTSYLADVLAAAPPGQLTSSDIQTASAKADVAAIASEAITAAASGNVGTPPTLVTTPVTVPTLPTTIVPTPPTVPVRRPTTLVTPPVTLRPVP